MEKENSVSIWFGYFESEREFNEFLDEVYTEDEDLIDSPFQKHFNCDYYDSDFCERAYYSNRKSLRDLVQGASYLDSFSEMLSTQDSEYNCVYLIYDFEYDRRIKSFISESSLMYFFQAVNYVK